LPGDFGSSFAGLFCQTVKYNQDKTGTYAGAGAHEGNGIRAFRRNENQALIDEKNGVFAFFHESSCIVRLKWYNLLI